MKRIIKFASIALTLLLGAMSCQEPVLGGIEPDVDGDYVTVSFKTQIPDMPEVVTKAVDPDGEDITKLVLFCFNQRGVFISAETVVPITTSGLTGTYDVELPVVTDRVHIIANLHKNINEDDLLGMSESEVISTMEGSSGMMSYWARVTKGTRSTIKEAFEQDHNPVMLLRDHARITVVDNSSPEFYTDLAFIALNTSAFGTVAPFNEGVWEAPSISNMFVTMPENDLKVTGITDVVSVDQREYQYVFETENTSDDPVCVIVRGTRGGVTKYYRVMLIDQNGEFVPVMRNHTYSIEIKGELDYGQDSFEAALDAPATNNVWLSVADDVKEVSSADYTLAVRQTHIVLGADDPVFSTIHRQYTIHYSLKSLVNGTPLIASDMPEISWLDGNDVAQHTIDASEFVISADGMSAEGTVDITLLTLDAGHQKREGTLLIKKGLLERKVKIVTVAKQEFTPAWITTNVYGGETGSKVTLMFHIDENCPEELFPIDVLVSVNDLDVRNESGMTLPLVMRDDDRYGKDVYADHVDGDVFTGNAGADPIGYKYVLTVTEPGDQRLYLETILQHQTSEYVEVTIEADYFNPLTKVATFQENTDYRILLHNLRSYVAQTPADDVIYYYLVPQKINAEVEFSTHLGVVFDEESADYDDTFEDALGTHWVKYVAPNVDFDPEGGYNVDEFLLYSQNLEHNYDKAAGEYYFDFYRDLSPSNWSATAGRVLGFFRNNVTGTVGQGAVYHLRTTTPKADEVVRIASNMKGAPSVTTGTKGEKAAMNYAPADGKCTGTGSYKSCIFELSTFHPFHFSAQVDVAGNKVPAAGDFGKIDPAEDNISLGYAPGQSVNVEFDITSFTSSIEGVSADEQLSVDPFGTAFDVYIDAPTLKLDEAKVAEWGLSEKIMKHSTIPGRIVYRVNAERDDERWNSSGTRPVAQAFMADNARLDLFRNVIEGGVDQSGERKVIPFLTDQIVSAGDITLSSDETKVVYYRKTFRIQNLPVTGAFTYGASDTPVPAGTFVPFSTEDGTRIGVVTVGDNGSFELRLRAEYDFGWNDTPVKFECKVGGSEYKASFDSLEAMVAAASAISLQ